MTTESTFVSTMTDAIETKEVQIHFFDVLDSLYPSFDGQPAGLIGTHCGKYLGMLTKKLKEDKKQEDPTIMAVMCKKKAQEGYLYFLLNMAFLIDKKGQGSMIVFPIVTTGRDSRSKTSYRFETPSRDMRSKWLPSELNYLEHLENIFSIGSNHPLASKIKVVYPDGISTLSPTNSDTTIVDTSLVTSSPPIRSAAAQPSEMEVDITENTQGSNSTPPPALVSEYRGTKRSLDEQGGRINPGQITRMEKQEGFTFKLDNSSLYRRCLQNADVMPNHFKHFFSKNFACISIPDMNNEVYKDEMSFDIVHLINRGAYMARLRTNTIDESIVTAFTACEVLFPAVPEDHWMTREQSVAAVRRYGSLLLSREGLANSPELMSHINSLFIEPTPATHVQYRQELNKFNVSSIDDVSSGLPLEGILEVPELQLMDLELILTILKSYIQDRINLAPQSTINERLKIFYEMHISVAKLGDCSKYQINKFQQELKNITNHDISINATTVNTIYKYGGKFINEDVAHYFFSRLYSFVPEESTIHFQLLFQYTRYAHMSGLRMILAAIKKFPEFNWSGARALFPADFNAFMDIIGNTWNRPYMAFSKIPSEYGMKNYKCLAYLCKELLLGKGGTLDQGLKFYKGFGHMPEHIVMKVKNLIEQHGAAVLPSAFTGRPVTLQERQEAFDTYEVKLQQIANASHRLDIELAKLDGGLNISEYSKACLESANDDVQEIREKSLLPIRAFRPTNGPVFGIAQEETLEIE